jgi:hypothetical protein
VSKFKRDIRHIFGQDNVVAGALSRVESVTVPPSYDELAASLDSDELRTHLRSTIALRLQKHRFPAPQYLFTVTYLPGILVGKFMYHSGIKCSSPSTISHTGKSNNQATRTAFRVARLTEGLPNLGTGLLGLPLLQSHSPHCYSSGRIHTTGSPFSSCLYRPRWASSAVSSLYVLPYRSRPLHALARNHPHP